MNLPKYLDDVKSLYDQNKDIEEIGSILEVKPETVKRYIRKINDFEKENIIKKVENKEKTIDEINELQDYKEQTKYWRNQYNKVVSQSSLESKLVSLLDKNIEKYPYIPLNENYKRNNDTKEILHLMLSDWHIGENISSEELLGMNEYNIDIVRERAQKIYTSACKVLDKMKGYEYETIHINILGDMISGIIHEELIANGINVTEQIIFGAEIVSDIIHKFALKFPKLIVTGVIGNHGRTKKKPYFKEKYNNFDYIFYKFIECKCENLKNVSFNFPKSAFAIIKNFNYNFLLMHGDGINSFNGIPWYGIKRMDMNMSQLMSTQANFYPHYILMGHFHTTNSLEKMGGEILMNGSLKGTDEYCVNKMFVGGTPSQTMFSVHPENGITWRLTLNCK